MGVGFYRLALLGTAFAGGTLWALGRSGYGASRKLEYLLDIEVEGEMEEAAPARAKAGISAWRFWSTCALRPTRLL